MKISPRSETDAVRVATRKLLPVGWYDAQIEKALERPSRRGKEIIDLTVIVLDPSGDERSFKDYLTNSPLGAAKLRHACEAVGALARYESGEISATDFVGQACRVLVGVQKQRGYPDRNVIQDFQSATRVVSLRSAG